jgi:G3E family GTPase
MAPPLPVTVLTGFLGAGKTTLLVRLLRDAPDARAAVVLNEIGVAGTEELDVKQQKLELTQGCVCCVRADDLIAALDELAKRDDIDRVIIETTGIADPLALTFVLERPDVAERCRLDGVVTVVDALGFEAMRGPEWESQLRAADLVVLTKLDVAPAGAAARAEAAIAELNPVARRIAAADADAATVFGVERVAPRAAADHAHHSGFAALSIVGRARYDADTLEDLLETLPPEIVRAKGIAALDDGRWMSFHVVGGRAQVDLEARRPAHGESRLVFIGRGVDEEALRAALEDARAQE